MKLARITTVLLAEADLHAYYSRRVRLYIVRIVRGHELVGYGEHPFLLDALANANEDLEMGHPDRSALCGIDRLHLARYIDPVSDAEKWLEMGNKMFGTYSLLNGPIRLGFCLHAPKLYECAIAGAKGESFVEAFENAQRNLAENKPW